MGAVDVFARLEQDLGLPKVQDAELLRRLVAIGAFRVGLPFEEAIGVFLAARASDELIPIAAEEADPLKLSGTRILPILQPVDEGLVESSLYIIRKRGKALHDGGMVAANRAVGFVGFAIDVDGVAAEHLEFGLLIHDHVFLKSLTLEWVAKT